jgi:NADPH:quinone reductase-like Zn-dependent oxidoreductase
MREWHGKLCVCDTSGAQEKDVMGLYISTNDKVRQIPYHTTTSSPKHNADKLQLQCRHIIPRLWPNSAIMHQPTNTSSTITPTMATLELPETQKSLLFNTSTLSLSLDPHAPLPSPGVLETEHLIRVHATAITAGELTWGPFMKDYWGEYQVPCYDVSGTVLTRVPGSRFIPGDKIYGRIMATRPGAAREYGTVLPSEAAKVPAGLDMLEAASIPMSALTAWQALFEHGNLTASYAPPDVPHIDAAGNLVGGQAAGKRLLVLGAASSVGRMAVQFGKLAGAYIVGTASYANSEVVRALGADEVVDYHDTSMREWVRGEEGRKFDLVFDCVGGGSMRDGWNAVREDGAYSKSLLAGA